MSQVGKDIVRAGEMSRWSDLHSLPVRLALKCDTTVTISGYHFIQKFIFSRSEDVVGRFQLFLLTNKKLGFRRETARCFLSLNISLSHSRSFKIIGN